MYTIKRADFAVLKDIDPSLASYTACTSYPWLLFLMKNQKSEPVVLEVWDKQEICAYFVGMKIKRMGVTILGSPFEGWLTPDMGFIRLKNVDNYAALLAVKEYAFRNLGCLYVQIIDKMIDSEELPSDVKAGKSKDLYLDIAKPLDDILNGFTKNGRRDVRAAGRKGLEFVQVSFDKAFAENYYSQLEDVFDKQNLKPFYSIEKIYDLVEAFKDLPEYVLALEARREGKCIATLLSFGCGQWAYYLGAASYRDYQKYLPNEGLFWEFVKYWNSKGIKTLDLVGYREYKLKYNPIVTESAVVKFERFPGIIMAKELAKKIVATMRDVKSQGIAAGRNK